MRLKPWEFRLLLVVAIGSTITMMFLPEVPPAAAAGVGGLLTWLLTNLKTDDGDKEKDRGGDHVSR